MSEKHDRVPGAFLFIVVVLVAAYPGFLLGVKGILRLGGVNKDSVVCKGGVEERSAQHSVFFGGGCPCPVGSGFL